MHGIHSDRGSRLCRTRCICPEKQGHEKIMSAPEACIGAPVERVEDLRLLRGRGRYVDDLARPGMLHAVVLRSSVAHGHVVSIDVSRALAMPGVQAVITAVDIAHEL